MLQSFFAAAMLAPGRHRTFRRTVGLHVLLLSALGWAATPATLTPISYLVLVIGIVEGAALVGWRLTQLPKSQALEFLLMSPLQPRGLFLSEAIVGVARFGLVCLAGLPVFVGMLTSGVIQPHDLWPLMVMPFAFGVVTGLGVTVWTYEHAVVKRVGEILAGLGVLVYLVVGILAGEHLRLWLAKLPPTWAEAVYQGVMTLHNGNPFGVVRNWFDAGCSPAAAWGQFTTLHEIAGAVVVLLALRGACRLKGHFHDRHYKPISSARAAQTESIGERPLSWWAVRRVMEFSGRSNLYLAGGFSLLYAAYLVADDAWPPWMGRLVFQIFETWGGAPMVATAMVVMATVPAAFQYGLWDSGVPERCRRLELLLLTDLGGRDYWRASLASAWRRGRGYLVVAALLWVALAVSGRATWLQAVAAAVGGAAMWLFAFAVGFRAFCTGNQASGIASLLTLGLPLILFALLRAGWDTAAAFVPTAASYLPLRDGLSLSWLAGLAMVATLSVALTRRGLARCDDELRAWYDANQGRKQEM